MERVQMGQYHMTVNLDKREYINPHKLGAGLKLWEQLANDMGPGKALVILLAHPEARGGGDFDIDTNWHGPERKDMTQAGPMPEAYPAIAKRTIGRWRGDRIAVVGDYAEDGDIPGMKPNDPPLSEIYGLCHDERDGVAQEGAFHDVSEDVCAVIAHELGGAFVGDGWRNFYREGQRVEKWANKTPNDRSKVEGRVVKITPTKISVEWDIGTGKLTETWKHAEAPHMFTL